MLRIVMGMACCVALGSCVATESADYRAIEEDTGVRISLEAAPADAVSVGMVHASESGFYLLGLFPMRLVSVDRCARSLAKEAQKLGGDGIASIEVLYRQASLISIAGETVFQFPWVASIQMVGQAYRHAPEPRQGPAPQR